MTKTMTMRRSPIESAIFVFERLSPRFEEMPIAARRALNHAGLELSVEGWRSLSLDGRQRLAVAGAAELVDTALVRTLVRGASPQAHEVKPSGDPDAMVPPSELVGALPSGHFIEANRWARLRALDRFALIYMAQLASAQSSPSLLEDAFSAVLSRPPTIPAPPAISTHLGPSGEVHMVDTGSKPITTRRAVASASVQMRPETALAIAQREAPKGEVLATARIAGIMAAKRTPELIPLCHGIHLTSVTVDIDLDVAAGIAHVVATAEAVDRTGVEMEAMVAASTASLTIYDMLKGIDREMVIREVKLLEKSGGRSGHFRRSEEHT